METQEFISKYLSEARGFLPLSEAAELGLYVVFYLSLNKDRIDELKKLQENQNSIDFLPYVYEDFSKHEQKNNILGNYFFKYSIHEIHHSIDNNIINHVFKIFLNYYSSREIIDFSLVFKLLLEILLDTDKYKTDFYLSEQEANLIFDEDLKKYLSECETVYFPFLKTAQDVTLLNKFGLSKNCLILANEGIFKVSRIAKMNLIINGFTNFQIENDFAFRNIPVSHSRKIDFVFSFTPFRMDLRNVNISSLIKEVYQEDTKKPSFLSMDRLESSLLMTELSLQLASEKGKVLAYETGSFFFDSNLKDYRKYLVNNSFIDKIVIKEGKRKTTSAVIDLVLFDKNINRLDGQNIDFISNEEIFIMDTILHKDTAFPFGLNRNNYNLSPSIYLNSSLHELDNQLKKASNLSTIKTIISSIKRGSHVASSKQFAKNQENYINYVRVGDLSKSTNGNYLDLSKIDLYVEKSSKTINYSCVLVSLLGTNLNSTCFNYEDQSISIGSDVFAIQLKQNIKLEYFVYQLKTRLVQIQAEMLAKGTVISRIDKEDFLNIQFVLPSLEEQEKQLFEIRNVLANQANAQKEVDEILNQAKYSDYQLIASVAHSFKNKISPLLMDYDELKSFLDNQQALGLDKKVRPIFEGETAEDVDTYQDIINRIEKQLLTLRDIFNDVKILQKQELNTKQENISDFMKNLISNYKNTDYKIKVIPSKKPLFVLLDSEAFRSVLENLIDNAKNHAFKSMNNKENCKIEFEIKKVEEKINGVGGEYAQIIYKDNGKGFPKGYTFESYKLFGNKSVQSGGMGIGGFIISKMIELHGGTINLLSTNPNDEFTTQISILLPLS